MQTVIILTLLASGLAAAPDLTIADRVARPGAAARVGSSLASAGQQTEAERERIERERERAREQAERERERAREQADRERERAQQERQRALEQAQRERERTLEQAQRERDRAREQAERDRERARELADRERERAHQERERARDGSIQEIERVTRTVRIGAKGELHLSNVAGDIQVSRGTGSDAQIEIVKTARGRTSDDAREMLKLVDIEVVERPTRAEVITHYPSGDALRRSNRRSVNVSVAFNVTVPAATRIRATSVSGSLSARDLSGDAVLKSVSGTVRVNNGRGACTAESISGNIEVTDLASDGPVSTSSASGNIVFKRVKARRVGVSTISGAVMLDDTEGPSIDAKSVSGNVHVSGVLTSASRYELGSHSGNVSAYVGGAAGFEVQATSFSGSVRSDIQFKAREPDSSRGRLNRTLRGVVGDGGAMLNLSTFSGNIVIGRR